MSKQRNKAGVRGVAAKRLVVLLITLALLTVPIALYFTVYISSRTSYLTNRDFRQLASVSVQLEERIGLLKDLFVKAVKQTIADTNKPQAGLEAFQQHLGNKKTLAADTAPELKEPLSAGIAKRITDGLESRVVMEVVTAGESSTIYFALPGSPELPRGFRAKAELEEIVTPLIGKHTLESRKGSEHEEGFDALVIASLEQKKAKDQQQTAGFSSSIIFQQGSSDLDVDSLDNLANANVPDKTIDVRTLSENSTLADVQLAGTTYKIYSQPITIAVKTATPVTANSSSEKEANVSEKSETNWVVCGLVQDSHFRHEAWAFPYTWFILFVFASVVIILSWPFVKLQFIGPKDRLRLADFYWLGFSLLVGGAMLTFFLLYGVSYLRTDALLDQQLEQTSSDINARFQDEVALILKQVDNLKAQGHNDFQSIHEGESRVISPDTGDARIGPTQLGDDRYPNVTKADILRDDKLKAYVENGVYPYFRRAAWINKQGDARLEWTISPGPTLVDVTDRDFFRKLIEGGSRDNAAYDRSIPAGASRESFWLEPVTSRLTTERIVVVSSSINKPVQNEGRVNLIVLGDAAMMSLMRTIVPAGLGYRVIDNSGNDPSDDRSNDPGKVLFQSSESQQLKENFFEECDNNPSLRSLVFSRATGFADVNYKGDSHRLFIRPMNGFPNWSLVVFRNKQPLRTLYVHILTVAGFIFFFYAILLLLPLTIAYLVRVRNHRTEWIWPSTQKADVYRKTHYAYFLLCALSLAITLGLLRLVGIDADRWTPIVLVSLIAFIGVLILAFRPKLTRPLDKLESIVIKLKMNNLLDRGNIYVWNIVALLVLMGVLPALTFYKVAYNEELKLFAKRSQLALVQGLGERYRRVKAQYSTERADAATNPSPFGNKSNEAQQFIDRRLRERRDIYTDFGTQLGQTAVQNTRPDPGLDGLMTSLVRTVPSFNETSVEMEGLTQGGAADDIWKWRIPVDANNLLRRELPTNNEIVLNLHLPGRTDAIISTQLQRFGSTWRLGLLWITVGFVAIVFLLFGIVQFVVRKVFLLDLAENLYLPTSPTDAITQNVFLVQTSPLATTNGAVNGDPTSAPYHYIDLSTKASQDEWVRKLEAEVKAQSASAVVVDHFEFRMDDRNHNYQKLKFIKFLIGSNKHVLIKSSHLPSSYPFTGTARDTLKHRPNQSSDSWAEVMTHFRRSYESRANEQILLEAIENLKGALQSNPALEYRKDRTLRLAELIKSECAGSVWLANIGKELIETLATEDLQSHQIVAQLTDRAELCYLQIWNTCSSDEKLTLLHLAQDRLLSYRDRDIEPLMQKGLIVCMPDIRLMNETFKAFVLQECLLDVDESAKLQSAEIKARKSSHLESLQIPIFVGVVGVVLFLVLTQKDMFGSPLTLITAATTSIPTVFKVLSLFQGDNTGQKVFHT